MKNFRLKKDYSSIITFTLEEIDIIMSLKFKATRCDQNSFSVESDTDYAFYVGYLINDAAILREIRTSEEKEIDKSCGEIMAILFFDYNKRAIGASIQSSRSQYIFEELMILQGNDYDYIANSLYSIPSFSTQYPEDYQKLNDDFFNLLKTHGYID